MTPLCFLYLGYLHTQTIAIAIAIASARFVACGAVMRPMVMR